MPYRMPDEVADATMGEPTQRWLIRSLELLRDQQRQAAAKARAKAARYGDRFAARALRLAQFHIDVAELAEQWIEVEKAEETRTAGVSAIPTRAAPRHSSSVVGECGVKTKFDGVKSDVEPTPPFRATYRVCAQPLCRETGRHITLSDCGAEAGIFPTRHMTHHARAGH